MEHWAAIKSTECICSNEQKQRASRLFDVVSEACSHHPDSSAPTAGSRIESLPREILHKILKTVYESEERSRDLCQCARPKSPYSKIRKNALEHRIVNTLVLRNVCSTFHKWCLEEVLRGHPFDDSIGIELEVDFSDFDQLEWKFRNRGGVLPRLIEDFPAIKTSGIIIYLGNPGDMRNMVLVLGMLKETLQNVFSGVSLWDLDHYYRDFSVEFENFLRLPRPDGKSHLDIDESQELGVDGVPPRVLSRRFARLNQEAKDSWSDICYEMYSEDQFVYGSILSQLTLDHWPHSAVHVPISNILDLTRLETGRRTIAGLVRGCTSVVFREFKSHFGFDWGVTREIIAMQFSVRCGYEPRMNQVIILADAEFTISDWESRTTSSATWCGMSHQISEPLDAVRVEYRHHSMSEDQRPNGSNPFVLLSSTFKDLEQCVVLGGNSYCPRLEEVVKVLLPTSETLKTLIHRPEYPAFTSGLVDHTRSEVYDFDHTCDLIREFPNLQNLEMQSRICPSLFEDDSREVSVQRNWVFDVIEPCGWDKIQRREKLEAFTFRNPQTIRQHAQVAKEKERLGLACRTWMNKHEVRMGKHLDWSITYHTRITNNGEDIGRPTPCSHREGNCRLIASFHEV